MVLSKLCRDQSQTIDVKPLYTLIKYMYTRIIAYSEIINYSKYNNCRKVLNITTVKKNYK